MIKIDLHPPDTPKPSKNAFYLNKTDFEGFGVPGGCKSILIIKTLQISTMTKLFGLRVLFF